MNEYFPIEYLVLPLITAVIIVALCVLYLERSRREKHRVELQKAILERVGSVKDFAEFLTTEQGERFLAALAPTHFRAHHRGLWSVRVGVVVLTIGVFLMFALHTTWFGSSAGRMPMKRAGGGLATAAVLLLLWSVPGAFAWLPRLTF